jgi:hypothetical protein
MGFWKSRPPGEIWVPAPLAADKGTRTLHAGNELPGPNTNPDFAKNHQIESEDEDPAIYDMYTDELKRKALEAMQPQPNYRPR